MSKGRPRKSVSELKLHGTYRSDRHGDRVEAEPSEPSCPTWLIGEAKKEWKRVCPKLVALIGLSQIDRAALTLHCEAWGDFYTACRELKKLKSPWIKKNTRAGEVLDFHPAYKMKKDAADRMLKAAVQMGLTPSARSRLNMGENVGNDTEDFEREFLA